MEQEITSQNEPQADVVAKANKSYSHAVLNIGIFTCLSIGLQFLLGKLVWQLFPNLEGSTAENVSYLLAFLPMYCIAFPIYVLLSRKQETAPPKQEKLSIGWFFGYLMIGKALAQVGTYMSMILGAIVSKICGADIQDTTLSDAITGDNPGLILLFAVLGAPIVEELICRKIFIDRVRKYGDGKAIVMSGLLFGMLHGNFTQLFYTAGLGFLLAFVYVKTGRIIYTILLHMAFNFLGSVAPLLMNVDKLLNVMSPEADLAALQSGEMVPAGIYLLLNCTLIIGGAILLIVEIAKGRLFHVEEPEEAIPAKKNFYVTCLHIGMAVFLAVTIATFVLSII